LKKEERPETEKIIKKIQHFYETDDRPFALGFSGGKDSTVTADLVMKALLRVDNPQKPVYLSFSDTQLEMDNTITNINDALESLRRFAEKHKIPLVIKRVEPIPEESYMYLLVGRGYSVPRRDNRWCTDRLKIRPQQRELEEMKNLHSGGYLNIVGTRKAESKDRADRIERNTIDGMLKSHDADNLSNVLMPVEDMLDADIWTYIMTESSDWVDGNELSRVYQEANQDGDKECATLLDGISGKENQDYKAGCSQSARYGCWICTLFEKDKTLNSLATHYDYMTHMEDFRNWLTGFRDGEWSERDLYNHRDHTQKIYDRDNHRFGMSNVGGYTLDFRKKILDRLLDLDTKVYPERGVRIITDEELINCQEAWVREGDIELTLLQSLKEKQDRTLPLSDTTIKLIELVNFAKLCIIGNEQKENPEERLSTYFHGKMSERFITQLVIQLQERTVSPVDYLESLVLAESNIPSMDALKVISNLPALSKQFFPTEVEERIIREEWNKDKAYIHTTEKLYWKEMIEKPETNLFGFDGTHGAFFDHLESGLAVDEDPNISMEEKYAFFDNWIEEDRKELSAQVRSNITKDRPVFEGVDEYRNLDYAYDFRKNTAAVSYAFRKNEFSPICELKGKEGIEYLVSQNSIPEPVIHILEDKNDLLRIEQKKAEEKRKREAKKGKKNTKVMPIKSTLKEDTPETITGHPGVKS